jgi:hypothetical protein
MEMLFLHIITPFSSKITSIKKLYPYFILSVNKLHGMVTLPLLDFSSYTLTIREKSTGCG